MAKGKAVMAEIDGVGNRATAGSDQCRKVVAAIMRRRQRRREEGSLVGVSGGLGGEAAEEGRGTGAGHSESPK